MRSHVCLPLWGCLLTCALGCGPGEGKVTGLVFFEGKPLPGGRVTFRPADPRQNTVSAEIGEAGTYQTVLPAGECAVCVDNRELEPPARFVAGPPPGLSAEFHKAVAAAKTAKDEPKPPPPPAEERPSGRYVRIPERYYTVEQSQLKFTVHQGEQQYNIDLKR